MKAVLGALPHGKMIVLDLYSETVPVWSNTNGFYGTNYIWNMLHNFGLLSFCPRCLCVFNPILN